MMAQILAKRNAMKARGSGGGSGGGAAPPAIPSRNAEPDEPAAPPPRKPTVVVDKTASLSDDEFMSTVGMSRGDFGGLPKVRFNGTGGIKRGVERETERPR